MAGTVVAADVDSRIASHIQAKLEAAPGFPGPFCVGLDARGESANREIMRAGPSARETNV